MEEVMKRTKTLLDVTPEGVPERDELLDLPEAPGAPATASKSAEGSQKEDTIGKRPVAEPPA
eukprot:8964256-Alexandrium_andersonii.AAC.1